MQPAVPFALLGAVELLAVFAWCGLAVGALVRSRGQRPGRPALLLVAGSVLLAAVDLDTSLAFGAPSSVVRPLLRTAGHLLAGAGLALGALGTRRRRPAPCSPATAVSPGVLSLPGVVVPLAAGTVPALLAGLSGVGAAAAAVWARRDVVGVLLGAGLLLAGGAGLAGTQASDRQGALLVLLLRLLSSAALLAALVVSARSSLLGKVVAAILAGVLTMAVAAVGVVGSVVVHAYDDQARGAVERAAPQARTQLLEHVDDAALPAALLPAACAPSTPGPRCARALALVPRERAVVVRVPRGGRPQELAISGARLSAAQLSGLSSAAAVTAALGSTSAQALPARGLTRLAGDRAGLAVLAVAAEPARDRRGRPLAALAYVVPVDDRFVREVLDIGDDDVTLIVGGQPVASDASPTVRGQAGRAVTRVTGGVGAAGRTVPASGPVPTVRLLPLPVPGRGPAVVLAVARDAGTALGAQRGALRALVLVATGLVAGLALLLGRRTVEPVRRLTAAAGRVSSGDLSVSTATGGRDEVAVLSRTFDSMTGSLGRLTEDLRASAVRLQAALSAMSDGLVTTDRDGRVTSINPAALAMAGLDDEQRAVGRPLEEAVCVKDASGASLSDPALELRDAAGEVLRADGSTVPVRVELTALADDEGAVLVLRDTTREREVERMKTEFLSNVSHELRTPLTPIRGYADILASRGGLRPEQVQAFAGTILAESLKMNRVVDLLVDVAAIEAGRVRVRPRPVDVQELLDARIEHWRGRVPERAGDLGRRLPAGLPPVLVDPEWLGKALDELLDNALKHTPPGTPVTLGASPGPDGRVRVYVADRGPGIAAADQRLLFASFEQVDGSATRRVGGLGLGLSFVSRIAEDAGFPLTVASAPERGSEFSLDVPPARPSAPRRRRAGIRRVS